MRAQWREGGFAAAIAGIATTVLLLGAGGAWAQAASDAEGPAPSAARVSPEGSPWAAETPAGFRDAPADAGPQPIASVERASRSVVERVWQEPAESLEARVTRTRRAALEVGAWSLDPAARALLRGDGEGTLLERAQAAVALAPDLPAAHMALAKTLWLHEDAPMDAVRAVVAALASLGHHAEASLWFAGSALYLASVGLLGGALLVILYSALVSVPHAAHDLSHLLRVPVPGFAGLALLCAFLLAPLAAGEGLIGLTVAMLAFAALYGGAGRRVSLALAAVALFCGLYPLPRLAGGALGAFANDPVAAAAFSTAQGLASPVDLVRLERAADEDPLAARGLAIQARRTGNLGTADAFYQRLLEHSPDDVALINNAANVRLDLGHVDSALELYDRALELAYSPVVLFNLSQAYGRSFQVDELNRALADAQDADGELVAHFTSLQRSRNQNFVVDFPLTARMMWRRTLARDQGEELAAELRAPIAPGRLGASRAHLGVVLALAMVGAWLLSSRFTASRWCVRCGGLQCTRCGESGGAAELCDSCMRLFHQPERTDRKLRAARIEALRRRERRVRRAQTIGAVALPGAAGLLIGRPIRGLVAAVCFVFAAAAVFWRGGVVPDPLVAGAAGPVAFLGAASVTAFLYVATVATAIAARRES